MRSLYQSIPGDPTSLVVGNVPIPEPPDSGQMLIRVHCAAINRLDLFSVDDKREEERIEGGFVPGIEISGTIVSLGDNIQKNFLVNDVVMAMIPDGGYAEFVVADERCVIPRLSSKLSMFQLAAVPVAFMAAYQLCFMLGRCVAGECVVLHAGASSVGQAAIQMLVRKGVKVFATVRQEAKRRRCLELGAYKAFVLNGDTPYFADMVRTYNDGNPVDCILDPVGAPYLEQNVELLGLDGRIVLYHLHAGGHVFDPMLLNKLLNKRLSIITSTLHTRSLDYHNELVTTMMRDPDAFPAVASGEIQVQVDRTFEMEEILQAHEHMKSNSNIGKIVISVTSTASAIEFFGRELNSMSQRNNMRHSIIHK